MATTIKKTEAPLCNEEFGSCFAQIKDLNEQIRCKILAETYTLGQCPFMKERREITDDICYPFDPYYGMALKPGKEKKEEGVSA